MAQRTPTRTLHIGGVPPDAQEAEILDLAKPFGQVVVLLLSLVTLRPSLRGPLLACVYV